MKNHRISKLLNNSILSKFVTRKWIQVNYLSNGQYFVNKNIRFKTYMLRSDLCDYSDAYIVVKGTVDFLAANTNENYKAKKDVAFKSNGLFKLCISEINNTSINSAESLLI